MSCNEMVDYTFIVNVNIILEVKANEWWTSRKMSRNIRRNDCSFVCPVIYTDSIHNAILFIDTSIMLDTTKLIH